MYFIVLIVILGSSFISGVLGMAGGIILMGFLTTVLPLVQAMTLHGVTQLASNGSRAWLHRDHIQWKVLLFYFPGSILILATFTALQWAMELKGVFFLLGVLPLLSFTRLVQFDIQRPSQAFFCGLLITTLQMLAGASGPLLDVFYLKTKMNRFQIIATKATSQALGHLLKVLYFGWLLNNPETASGGLPIALFFASVLTAFAGTYLGKQVLISLSNKDFKKYGKTVVVGLSLVYLAQAIWLAI